MVDVEALKIEADAIMKQGFESFGVEWRQNADICSVTNFRPPLSTYAKMAVFSPEEIKNGEYRQVILRLGREAAEKLSRMVSETLQHSKRCQVTFLNGCEYPRVDACAERENGSVEIRGYYDFGVANAN